MTKKERPQGEWKIIEHETLYLMGIYQCNKCEYKYTCPDEFARNFCPNCGADMRKPNCGRFDHFGKCEGCEKSEEE